LGLQNRIININPTIADVGFNGHTNNPNFALYSGIWSSGSTPDITHFVNTPGVPLQIHLHGTDGISNTWVSTEQQNQTGGTVPFINGSRPFYCEFDLQHDSYTSDMFTSCFLEPQQHNNTQDDILPSPPAPLGAVKYEAWMEIDVMESNGSYEQCASTTHQWQGQYSGIASAASSSQSGTVFTTAANAFTANLCLFITGTAPSGFALLTPYYVLAAGLTTTTVSLAATPGGAAISAASSTSCTLVPGYSHVFQSNINTPPAIDFTQRHRFGVSYNPAKRLVTYYVDDVQTFQHSSAGPGGPGNLITGYDTWSAQPYNYYMILYPQTHGANTQYTMTVYNLQAWQ
jgi:hypothetical protein